LKLLDEALKDLEMGEGNMFLSLRGSLLDAQGAVRKDIFKPRGDIHLNTAGTQIVSLRIRKMLEVMLPNLVQTPVQTPPVTVPVPVPGSAPVQTPPAPVPAPVQTLTAKPQRTRVQAPVSDPAPVVVNEQPHVVNAPLVAEVVNSTIVVQHVAVVGQDQVETPMEVEDEDTILERLFFKKYGRALPEPEKEKEKESDVDNIKFVIDLTDDTDEMEVATPVVVVKTEPIETVVNISNANVADVAKLRQERRELVKGRKALIAFGKTLRKSVQIPEKEAPDVVADSNMSEDNTVEPVTVRTAEQAEMDADEKEFEAEFGDVPLDEFDDTGSGFRLYGPEDVLPSDDEDAMIDNV
jgi:hypothetical protein